MAAEHDAVVGDRCGEQRGRQRREQEVGDVEPMLFRIESGEHVGERQREQEAEEHLHADRRNAKLLEQLGDVAIDALRLGLVTVVVAVAELEAPSSSPGGFTLIAHVVPLRRPPVACAPFTNQETWTMSELPATLRVDDLGDGRWSAPHPVDDPEGAMWSSAARSSPR